MKTLLLGAMLSLVAAPAAQAAITFESMSTEITAETQSGAASSVDPHFDSSPAMANLLDSASGHTADGGSANTVGTVAVVYSGGDITATFSATADATKVTNLANAAQHYKIIYEFTVDTPEIFTLAYTMAQTHAESGADTQFGRDRAYYFLDGFSVPDRSGGEFFQDNRTLEAGASPNPVVTTLTPAFWRLTLIGDTGVTVYQPGFGSLNQTDIFTFPSGSVPEPATWAMMIVGLGMAGAGLRRRSNGIRETLNRAG